METLQLTETTSAHITPDQLLQYWQGNRRLTRRVIAAFPDEHFATFSIGGMRSFADITLELLDMAEGMPGLAHGVWKTMEELAHVGEDRPKTKAEILRRWDAATQQIDELWPALTPERMQQVDKAFGMYEGPVYSTLLYFIDNEIHHRGQGYVYLRALGVEPPPFWDRQ